MKNVQVMGRIGQLTSIFILSLLSYTVEAQTDGSTQDLSDTTSYGLLEQSLKWDRYTLFKQESSLLLFDVMPDRLSVTQLGIDYESGDYKTFQQPEKQSATTFRAEGGRKLKRIWLWGQFQFQPQTLDSVRWGHRKDEDSSTPFYYASQRAVHYQKTDYAINMAIGIPVVGPWSASVYTDYGMGDHYSTNDPRAVLKHFKLKLEPAIQYKKGNYGVEAKGVWGYGQQESQVDYRNKEYYESSQWPEYHNYLSYGYGTIRTALSFSDRVYTNNQDYRGLGMSMYSKGTNVHYYAHVSYESLHEEYDRGNSSGRYDGYDMYGDYDLNTWKGHVEASNTDHTWRIRLFAVSQRGQDYNFEFSGNNYKFYEDELGIQWYRRIRRWRGFTDIYGYGGLVFTGQRDGNMMIERERGRYIGQLKAEQQLSPKFRVTAGLAYSGPYKTSFLQSPRTTYDFIEQVIKHDVLMDNSSYWQPLVGARYFFDLVSFRWQAHVLWQGTFGRYKDTDTVSESHRSGLNASLSLYF